MGNQASAPTRLPAPNPNPTNVPTRMSPVAWVACVALVLVIVAVFLFVFLNRSRPFGRATSAGGCHLEKDSVSDVFAKNILTQNEHDASNARSDVLVVHLSNHCGFCQKFKPEALAAAKELGYQVVFSEVASSDANRDMFGRLGVQGVPAYTLNGQLIGVGYKPQADLVPQLKQANSQN